MPRARVERNFVVGSEIGISRVGAAQKATARQHCLYNSYFLTFLLQGIISDSAIVSKGS